MKHKFFAEKRKNDMIQRLEEMLESAEKGTFEESDYDETRLSRLEGKWKRYLACQAVAGRRLSEEQGRIKNLISDISHQTKTPIANILLYSQLLQEKETDKELIPLVENIRSQSEKLDFLIRSLVKASRLETDVLVLRPQKQPVAPMLQSVLAGAEEAAQKKHITLQLQADAEITADFDRKWTEEAIGNLLDNAIKYSPFGSEILISLTEYEMFAAVHVTDRGIGIREEEQAQIFERFYRSPEVSEEKGVGIGLYLVREIAARQQGYVKVKSRHREGSTFSFFLNKQDTGIKSQVYDCEM